MSLALVAILCSLAQEFVILEYTRRRVRRCRPEPGGVGKYYITTRKEVNHLFLVSKVPVQKPCKFMALITDYDI